MKKKKNFINLKVGKFTYDKEKCKPGLRQPHHLRNNNMIKPLHMNIPNKHKS